MKSKIFNDELSSDLAKQQEEFTAAHVAWEKQAAEHADTIASYLDSVEKTEAVALVPVPS